MRLMLTFLLLLANSILVEVEAEEDFNRCWNTHLRNILTTGPEVEHRCVGPKDERQMSISQLETYLHHNSEHQYHIDDDIVVVNKKDSKFQQHYNIDAQNYYNIKNSLTNGVNIVILANSYSAYFIGSLKENKWYDYTTKEVRGEFQVKLRYFVIFNSLCRPDDKIIMLKLAEFDWDYYDYCSLDTSEIYKVQSYEDYQQSKEAERKNIAIVFKDFMFQPPISEDDILKIALGLKSISTQLDCNLSRSCTYQIKKKLKKFAFFDISIELMSKYARTTAGKLFSFQQNNKIFEDISTTTGLVYKQRVFEIDKIQFQGDTQYGSKYFNAEWIQDDFFCALVFTQQEELQEAILILLYPGDDFILTKSHFQWEDCKAFFYRNSLLSV